MPLRKTTKAFPSRPRGRPPNINKHLTGITKPSKIKDHNFLTPSNPYSFHSLLYSQAISGSMDANAALNMMMSNYQQELLRQYSMGSSNPSLINPFASKNKPSTSTSQISISTIKETTPIHKPETVKIKAIPEKKESTDIKIRYSKETNKSYLPEPQKVTGNINMFMDRPGISIMPIQSSPGPSGPLNIASKPLPTSPNKTLQQKLAERQKQNPQKQNITKNPIRLENPIRLDNPTDIMNQLQNFSQKHISTKQAAPIQSQSSSHLKENETLKNLQKSIPASLTITKSQPQIIPPLPNPDSGISISQISPNFKTDNLMNFRKPNVPKTKPPSRKLPNEITIAPNFGKSLTDQKIDFPPNVPISLSITKTDNKIETKNDSDVEIITIE